MVFSLSWNGHSFPEAVPQGIMRLFILSGLPLVVEDLPGVRRICLLRADLRCLLLCEQGIPRG